MDDDGNMIFVLTNPKIEIEKDEDGQPESFEILGVEIKSIFDEDGNIVEIEVSLVEKED